MRISDWSSDVCSSDLAHARLFARQVEFHQPHPTVADRLAFGRARRRRGHERLPPRLIVRNHLVDLVNERVEVDAERLPRVMSAEQEEELGGVRQKLDTDRRRVVVDRVDRRERTEEKKTEREE